MIWFLIVALILIFNPLLGLHVIHIFDRKDRMFEWLQSCPTELKKWGVHLVVAELWPILLIVYLWNFHVHKSGFYFSS